MADLLGYTALGIAVLGWFSYWPVSKIPSMRKSMWPVWALVLFASLLAAGAIALSLISDSSSSGLIASMSALGLSVFFVLTFFLIFLIPKKSGRPEVNQSLPNFKVTCLDGQTRAIRDVVPQGPMLIVFFRGFW